MSSRLRLRLNEIAAAGIRILDPITDDDLRRLGELAAVRDGTSVLDLACGAGELPVRWAAWFGATGVGVDISETFVERARSRAVELGVADRVRFEVGDAAAPRPAGERYDVVSCLGAAWLGDGLVGTARLAARSLRPGGSLLLGDEHWTEPPPVEAIRGLGDGPDPAASLGEQVRRLEAAGFAVEDVLEAGRAGWDAYEHGRWRSMEAWLAANPGDPDADAVAARLAHDREVHERWGRRYLGWAVYLVRSTP